MRKLTVIFILLMMNLEFGSFSCFAQKVKLQNLPKYDHQWLHFGFSLGINKADFIIRKKGTSTFDSVYVIESEPQSGFNLGIVSNLRLSPYFDLRFIPSLSFVQRRLEYTFAGNSSLPVVKNIESTFLEFPLELKYKSVRINNGRAYVVTGVRFTIDLASQKNVKEEEEEEEEILKLKKYDYLYEIGFGLDFYLQYFKFSPEIKLAYGLNNMLVEDETVFSRSIEKLHSRMILISFTFE